MKPDPLISTIAKYAREIHPDVLSAVVRIIETNDINDCVMFEAEIGNRLSQESVAEICDAWKQCPSAQGRDLGIAFRTAALISQHYLEESVQLVATRPWDAKGAERDSLAAYLNLIKNAQHSITIAMYVIYRVDSILTALSEAENRGVLIRLLVEDQSGGKLSWNHNSVAIVGKYLRSAQIYIPNSSQLAGAMHAKFVCADRSKAFVTSANLSQSALSRNIELGTLISGGRVPHQIDELFDELITRGAIIPADES